MRPLWWRLLALTLTKSNWKFSPLQSFTPDILDPSCRLSRRTRDVIPLKEAASCRTARRHSTDMVGNGTTAKNDLLLFFRASVAAESRSEVFLSSLPRLPTIVDCSSLLRNLQSMDGNTFLAHAHQETTMTSSTLRKVVFCSLSLTVAF